MALADTTTLVDTAVTLVICRIHHCRPIPIQHRDIRLRQGIRRGQRQQREISHPRRRTLRVTRPQRWRQRLRQCPPSRLAARLYSPPKRPTDRQPQTPRRRRPPIGGIRNGWRLFLRRPLSQLLTPLRGRSLRHRARLDRWLSRRRRHLHRHPMVERRLAAEPRPEARAPLDGLRGADDNLTTVDSATYHARPAHRLD